MSALPRVLVIGYGNPGRGDDGLGPAFAEAVAARGLPGIDVEIDYQLVVEDAARVAEHDMVLFADAEREGAEAFRLRPAGTDAEMGFSSHAVTPGTVMALARKHFGAEAEGWLLGIRGYDFDSFGEGLTAGAAGNLARALEHMEPVLRDRSFRAEGGDA